MVPVESLYAVAQELRARPYLENVKKLGDHLVGRAGSFDPMLPKFQETNQVALNQMRTLLQQMTKEWPTTRATEEAKRIGEVYGVRAK